MKDFLDSHLEIYYYLGELKMASVSIVSERAMIVFIGASVTERICAKVIENL